MDGIILEEYRTTQVKEPIEKEELIVIFGVWGPKLYKRLYSVCDVSRGDSTDYSVHVIEIESLEQVEYKGRMSTRDYGNLLVNYIT